MTVSRWVRRHQEIINSGEEEDEPLAEFQAIEWALTGRDTVENQSARLDALQNRPQLQSTMPTIRRDYDSVLGFTRNIPARGTIMLYIRPSPIRALRKKLKLETMFVIDGEVSDLSFDVLYVSHCYCYMHHCHLIHPGRICSLCNMFITLHPSWTDSTPYGWIYCTAYTIGPMPCPKHSACPN